VQIANVCALVVDAVHCLLLLTTEKKFYYESQSFHFYYSYYQSSFQALVKLLETQIKVEVTPLPHAVLKMSNAPLIG